MDESGVLGEITAILGKHNVSIRSVIQKGDEEDGQVTIVLVTHRTSEAQIDGAVEEITSLKSVYKIDNIIRIEDFK